MENLTGEVNIYLLGTTIIFLFFGLIWKRNTNLNLVIKIINLIMGMLGAFLWMQMNGYIIHIPH